MKLKITGKQLREIGYPESPAISIALELMKKNYKHETWEAVQPILQEILANPERFMEHEIFAKLAEKLLPQRKEEVIELTEPVEYKIFGKKFIEEGAIKQMETAVRLPVAVGGALMPDAHQGYGLPIGGVLATRNAIIPYGVGVDIGCRMSLSIFDISEVEFERNKSQFKRELIAHTKFGAGNGFRGHEKSEHEILHHSLFTTNAIVKMLYDKAAAQLGSSGGGNHFVEWGIIEFFATNNQLNISAGKYVALLTHSGSRGLGATLAAHYTKMAREICKLPKEAGHLAYLMLDTEEGNEYWNAMNLAGDYASACHQIIHNKLAKAIRTQPICTVENHHNFAWKEFWNNEEVIVHRKGATPAGKGTLGIIPGSMTAPGFLVQGKGEMSSINSASHGAGRQMSRTVANNSFRMNEVKEVLKKEDVMLMGGGTDEAPMAYKDIHKVMQAQTDLVEILAQFQPKIVRMADDGSKED